MNISMNANWIFHSSRTRFDADYAPAPHTRITTNFANLARGADRADNIRRTLAMMNQRLNALAHWDNPRGQRYALELDILSVEMHCADLGITQPFPLLEWLQPFVWDRHSQRRTAGIVGNSFSSYVRDWDFSVRLVQHNAEREGFEVPEGFGDLHAALFKLFLASDAYKATSDKPPVICLSVAASKNYTKCENTHPILGLEYRQNAHSLTDAYFEKMGFSVRFFMPENSAAPMAFYFQGDLLNDYWPLELIATISTMESFQRIYRPEIYNAHARAPGVFQPSLNNPDYSLAPVHYDRQERAQLATQQGQFTQQEFIGPHGRVLDEWLHKLAA